MGPAAAGAPKKNVTAAAAAKTTTSHRPGWHIVAKITVTINGLQSDLQPGGLSASHKSEPQAPQELTWAEWGRPCRSPDGTRSAAPRRAERRPAPGSRDQAAAPRPVRARPPAGAPVKGAPVQVAGRWGGGRARVAQVPAPDFPPRPVVTSPSQVRGDSGPGGDSVRRHLLFFSGHPS